jgi:AraC-like DNA-binding protein
MIPSFHLLAPRPVSVEFEHVPATGSVTSDGTGRWPAKLAGTRRSRASLFHDARAIIQREYPEELAVEALARRVLASRRQLQRVFTEAGTSVRAELRAVRMQRAAELLVGSSLSVREVASVVGYRPPAHFSNAFRRRYGVTPSQYRKGVVVQADLQGDCVPRSDTAAGPATSSPRARPHPPR